MNKGTPHSLHSALINAKAESLYACKPEVYVIENHVRDFLSQKFGVYMLSENAVVVETLKKLWDTIFPCCEICGKEMRGEAVGNAHQACAANQ